MANKHGTLKALFTDIADSIRVKTGSTEEIIADNFPEEIAAINTSDAFELTKKDSQSFLPGGSKWSSAAYGNGAFVVTCSNPASTMMCTTDGGVSWTKCTLPSAYYNSVVFGNGVFVATTTSKTAVYSTDGINWNKTEMPASTSWNSVSYGDGKFVAVGRSGNIAYSTDNGISWTLSSMPTTSEYNAVVYGNGVFVSTRNTSSEAAYSTDGGVTWTALTLPNTYGRSIAYGNGKFVAVGYKSGTSVYYSYSEDGISWEKRDLPVSNRWGAVAYVNGMFVAAAHYSNKAAYSFDCATWTEITLPATRNWKIISTIGEELVIIAPYSDVYLRSSDGINWISHILSGPASCEKMVYVNNRFMALTYAAANHIIRSSDGTAWSVVDWPDFEYDATITDVTYGNGKYVAAADSGFLYSTDGINWTFVSTADEDTGNWYYPAVIVYGNGKFVALPREEDYCFYSTNGVSWTRSTFTQTDDGFISYPIRTRLLYGGSYYLAIDTNGRSIQYSTNGTGWTRKALNNADISDCVYADGKFVGVGSEYSEDFRYCAFYCTNPTSWTIVDLPFTDACFVITYGDGKFVTLGQWSTSAAYSTDGINWTMTTIPIDDAWCSVTYGNGTFVATTYDGEVMHSKDGIVWISGEPAVYNVDLDSHTGIALSAEGCEPQVLYKNGNMLTLGDYAGSLTFSGTYATATYFTESGCSLAVDPTKGMAFVTIQSGTNGDWENICFTAASLPSGVTLLTHPEPSHRTGGTTQSYFTAALTGITGKINVNVNLKSQSSSTYDSIIAELTVTYA